MSGVTLGKITSEPNKNGQHSLRCPQCSNSFLSTIAQDDKSQAMNDVICPACGHAAEPKYFVAAAHQNEVNAMTKDYLVKELSKAFKKFK